MDSPHTFRADDGMTLAYRAGRAGRAGAPVLVMIHGLASNLTRWSEFVEYTRLRADWDLLRVDLRGHGNSFTRRRIDLARWVEDLHALLDHERCDAVVIAGHSLGAQLAAHFAARYPARTRGLVLIDPIFRKALRGGLRTAAAFAPLLRALAATVGGLNAIGLRRRAIPYRDLRLLDEAARPEWVATHRDAEFVSHYSSVWQDLKFFPTANFMREVLVMTEPLPPPSALAMPVLAMLSSNLTYTDAQTTRDLLAQLPHCEISDVKAYHWPLTERPAEVREAIDAWCERLAG